MDKTGHATLDVMNTAKGYNDWLFSLLKPYLNGDILEVGCGIGNFTKKLTGFGKVTAIDIDNLYVKKTAKVASHARVGFGDIENAKYFFSNKKFDVIINLNVLEHIENDSIALRNMYKLLKPNGRLVLLTPAHMFAYGEIDKNLGHFRRYSKHELESKFAGAGFRVKYIRLINWLGLIGWFIS